MIALIYPSLRPREKLLEGRRGLLILYILINPHIAIKLMRLPTLMLIGDQLLLLAVGLLLLLGVFGIIDGAVLLVEDLVDQFLSLLLNGEMMRRLLLELLPLVLELQDIHFMYIIIPYSNEREKTQEQKQVQRER
jgi:hypothetical protein